MVTTISEHIEITAGVCGGRARIAGHRIRVHDIVAWHQSLGQSADEIVARYPQLSLADVHAALAYYFDNIEEIRRQMIEDKQFAEDLRARTPSKLKVAAKLTDKDRSGDSLSPG
jgi:uncharacterized protein (DUF433 family)